MGLPPRRDARFSWIEEGHGPVMLPIYGLLGDASNWAGVVRHFTSSYRVVIPILPLDDGPPGAHSVAGLVRFLAEFLEAHDLRHVNVVGNSLGGQLALLLSQAVPERIRTLTLSGSSGLGENYGPMKFTRANRSPSRDDRDLIRELALTTFHDPNHATPAMIEKLYQLVNHEPGKAQTLIAIARSSKRCDVSGILDRISQPTCLIWGRDDLITPAATAERFQRAIPHATLFWIERCGHAPMIEHPGVFNELLERWLAAPHERGAPLSRA